MAESGLTGEKAQALGLEYARRNFSGHQALVCTHMEGTNESGNIHIHIVINSVRKFDVEPKDFMERRCDSRAGYKHHPTDKFMEYLKRDLMEMCVREGLHQIDLLSPAQVKITEKEYWLNQRGQEKLDGLNRQIIANGMKPRRTVFQTQKQYLRDDLAAAYQEISDKFTTARKTIRATEDEINNLNEQIHYVGQYMSQKKVHQEFLKVRNKKKFREQHYVQERHRRSCRAALGAKPLPLSTAAIRRTHISLCEVRALVK